MADTDYAITNIGDPWTVPAGTGSKGATGDPQTATGTDGVSKYNSGSCTNVCSTEPTSGPPGNAGKIGGIGTPGAPGHPSAGGVYRLGQLTAPINILIGGGDGQQGGQGGPGGAGSPGGNPGTAASGCANKAVQGTQGSGGQGGPGGPGGPGGESGFVTVYFEWGGAGKGVNVTVQSVAGGDPGIGGVPGDGPTNAGDGVKGGRGTPGAIPLYALNNS